jgi:hypothetical protein
MRSTKYSLRHHLKYNQEANETMWSTCIVKQQIVSYWRIYIKSSKKNIWIRRSWILTCSTIVTWSQPRKNWSIGICKYCISMKAIWS